MEEKIKLDKNRKIMNFYCNDTAKSVIIKYTNEKYG